MGWSAYHIVFRGRVPRAASELPIVLEVLTWGDSHAT